MSKAAWELASGGAKDTALAGLFKGASLVGQDGVPVSAITNLKDKTVVLYFAASWAQACTSFNELLSKFYEMVRESDDSIQVIFVSNDKSKEEQLAFFREGGFHRDWLMVEWTYDLQDIMDHFNVDKIPSIFVVDREAKAVVDDGHQQIADVLAGDGRDTRRDASAVKSAVVAKWSEWRRLAGDWRASEGHTLGSYATLDGRAAAAASSSLAPGASQVPSTGGMTAAQSDREALRAARLAALERRMGGGGGGSSASSQAPPPAAAAPVAAAAAAPSGPFAAGGPQAQFSAVGPRIATVHGGTQAAAGSSGGSGTFAAGATGAPGGGVAYTLAGGRVELPPPVPRAPDPAEDLASDMASDMASDGAESVRDEAGDVDMDGALVALMSMGFSEEQAREALGAANGDVDSAVALLVGDA